MGADSGGAWFGAGSGDYSRYGYPTGDHECEGGTADVHERSVIDNFDLGHVIDFDHDAGAYVEPGVGGSTGRNRAGAFDGVLTRRGLHGRRMSADYVLTNPTEWTTPMGALCWAEFELYRTSDMLRERVSLDYDYIPPVIVHLELEDKLVDTSAGPDTSRAVIAILEGYTTTTTIAGTRTGPEYSVDDLNEAIARLKLMDYWGGCGYGVVGCSGYGGRGGVGCGGFGPVVAYRRMCWTMRTGWRLTPASCSQATSHG